MTTKKHDLVSMPTDLIYEFRQMQVMLDSDVAKAFGTVTKRVNEARNRNSKKFTDNHAFQLNMEEAEYLKSLKATSKTGRGGRRTLPWVYTVKGVGRLAMILDTPEALAASDLILDTFLEVYGQLKSGQAMVKVSKPSRFEVSAEEYEAAQKIRLKLAKAVSGLIDSLFELDEANLKQYGQAAVSAIGEDIIARFKTKPLENGRIVADTHLVLAQAREINIQADGKELDNLQKKIELVERLQKLHREMEPYAFIEMMDGLNGKIDEI